MRPDGNTTLVLIVLGNCSPHAHPRPLQPEPRRGVPFLDPAPTSPIACRELDTAHHVCALKEA